VDERYEAGRLPSRSEGESKTACASQAGTQVREYLTGSGGSVLKIKDGYIDIARAARTRVADSPN